MALETGDYITDLVTTNPVGATDSKSQGDDHLRLIKKTIKQTFPNMNGAVTATPSDLNLISGIAQHTITVGNFGLLANFNAASLLVQLNASAQIPAALLPPSGANPVFTDNANGNPNVSDTGFNIHSLTESTWVGGDIGATGSGATNTWTALDSVPSDADWIEIKVDSWGVSSGDTADTGRAILVYARDDGSSETIGGDNLISTVYTYTNSNGSGQGRTTSSVKVPITSRVFEAYWVSTFNDSTNITIYLVGYGYNG